MGGEFTFFFNLLICNLMLTLVLILKHPPFFGKKLNIIENLNKKNVLYEFLFDYNELF
jgi:hypothetical protein